MAMTIKEKVMTVSEQRLTQELMELLKLIRIFRTRCLPIGNGMINSVDDKYKFRTA